MRLVAGAVSARIHEDKLIFASQRLGIAALDPVRTAPEGAMVENDGRSIADGLVVDAHTPIVCERHRRSPSPAATSLVGIRRHVNQADVYAPPAVLRLRRSTGG